ncbi:hypothetical protein MAR_008266 [Mya arenaria]|uniref:Uncharacterized protein n=1 Tax=Mya arenaria TaxID=6604 RepID=A0ABY7DVH4_MYAAR|nr:hypothetical protein MAR_008266 [Mya arenaria]
MVSETGFTSNIETDDNSNALSEELETADVKTEEPEEEEAEEELAVQGPINREPFEKIYGKRPSGIPLGPYLGTLQRIVTQSSDLLPMKRLIQHSVIL